MAWFKNAHIRNFVHTLNNNNITFYSEPNNDINASSTLVKRFCKCMHFGIISPRYNYPRLIDAVNVNNLPIVQWLYTRSGNQYTHGYYYIIDRAAELGYLHIIKWFHSQTAIHVDNGINYAAMRGHWETVQWLLTHYPKKESGKVMECAAKAGKLDTLQWLHANVPNIKLGTAIYDAAENGHWGCMKWLFETYPYEKTRQNSHSYLISHAAKFGAIDIIEWLRDNVQNLAVNNAVDIAALNRQWETARWLLTNYPINVYNSSLGYAAYAGELDYIKWVFSENAKRQAANRPVLELYKPTTMDYAAGKGHLHVLEWLHNNCTGGCTKNAVLSAASGGHLECVKWLFINYLTQCTFESVNSAIINASVNGRIEVIKYLIEHRVEECILIAIKNAQIQGHLELETYLRSTLHPDLHMKIPIEKN